MKKILLSAAALLVAMGFTTSTLANFSLSVGIESVQMDIESHADRSIAVSGNDNGLFLFNDSEDNQSTGVGGEVALGYEYDITSEVNIGLEIFGQIDNTDVATPVYANYTDVFTTDIDAPVYDAIASFEWFAGARLRPGYYVTPTTRFFIDGGVVWGGFKLEQSTIVADYWNAVLGTDFDRSEKETLVGWRYGAGVEHEITDNFAIGLDFIVTEFEKFESDTIEDVAALFTNPGNGDTTTIHAESSYRPTLTTIGLNFKYIFGAKEIARQAPRQYYPMTDK